jgi:hypothetical protein
MCRAAVSDSNVNPELSANVPRLGAITTHTVPDNGTAKTQSDTLLFRSIRHLRRRIFLSNGQVDLRAEAELICRILFLRFVAESATDTDGSVVWLLQRKACPDDLYTRNIKPSLERWFGSAPSAESVNVIGVAELVSQLSDTNFELSRTSSGVVTPSILGYVYERWTAERDIGSHFTPDRLAEHIVNLAIHQLPHELRSQNDLRVLDPSVGAGAFLVAAARVLLHSNRLCRPDTDHSAVIRAIYRNSLYGLDISAAAVEVTRLRLWLLAGELGHRLSPTSLPQLPHLKQRDALSIRDSSGASQSDLFKALDGGETEEFKNFDLCVGNPPYIALSQHNKVPSKRRVIAEWNRLHPAYPLRSGSDLSNLFLLRGVEYLRPGGVLAYISSRNFFDTTYGEPVRRYLATAVELRNVFTLHEHPFIGEGAKVKANTVIFCVVRQNPIQPVRFCHLMTWDQSLHPRDGAEIDRERLRCASNWTAIFFPNRLTTALADKCRGTIGDYARVRMGIKSGCNSFFLLKRVDDCANKLASAGAVVPVVKNSRMLESFVLPKDPAHRLLNLYETIPDLEQGFFRKFDEIVARYVFERGISYQCPNCQSLAVAEHRRDPRKYPHLGMCDHCATCRDVNGRCDRAVDRLSTAGHRPDWYTLSLGKPPLMGVQCIVDTTIGVFFNTAGVYVTDQFQVITEPRTETIGALLFTYLNSRISHLILEQTALHRARFDGSFMLKIQVEHLRSLPCPAFDKLKASDESRLLRLYRRLLNVKKRRGEQAEILRDGIDVVVLDVLGYPSAERSSVQHALKAELDRAIKFRWLKSHHRAAHDNGN